MYEGSARAAASQSSILTFCPLLHAVPPYSLSSFLHTFLSLFSRYYEIKVQKQPQNNNNRYFILYLVPKNNRTTHKHKNRRKFEIYLNFSCGFVCKMYIFKNYSYLIGFSFLRNSLFSDLFRLFNCG